MTPELVRLIVELVRYLAVAVVVGGLVIACGVVIAAIILRPK